MKTLDPLTRLVSVGTFIVMLALHAELVGF